MGMGTATTFSRIAEDAHDDPFFGLEDESPTADWPLLTDLGLSDRQLAFRQGGLGGSDANIIFSGDPAALPDLWRQKRGEAPA